MRPSILLLATGLTLRAVAATNEPPTEWIDPDTGHRVIRLSTEAGSGNLYFHQNSFTPQGDKFVFEEPSGIVSIDVTKLGRRPVKPELIVPKAGTDNPELRPNDDLPPRLRLRVFIPRLVAAAYKTRDAYFFR